VSLFQVHSVVYKRGEDGFVGAWGSSTVSDAFALEVTASVTSLTINTNMFTLVEIGDIMAQLPDLDDLSLSWSLLSEDRGALLGIGTVLRGRFGGRLVLRDGCADEGVMNVLLEIPTGLRFTEVQIYCTHRCLSSAIRLVEACGNTLVKMSYAVTFYHGFHPFPWSNMRNMEAHATSRRRW